MRRLVIDTNVYIDWLNKGRHEDVLFPHDAVRYLSAVVLMELRAGAVSRADRRLVQRLETAFERAGRILAPAKALFAEAGLAESLVLPSTPAGSAHVYNQFVIRATDRDRLREHLQEAGIPTEIYYPSPLHLERAFSSLAYKPGDFPEAETASQQVLALPVCPELRKENQEAVVEEIAAFYAGKTEVGGLTYEKAEA